MGYHLAREMAEGGLSAGAEAQLAPCFGQRLQVLHRMDGAGGRHGNDQAALREDRDGRQVARGAIGQLAAHGGLHRQRGCNAQGQRVAVGRALDDAVDADQAARAGLVLHHNLGRQRLGKCLCQQATRGVHRAASRCGNHDADDAGRIGGSAVPGRGVCSDQGGQGAGQGAAPGNDRGREGRGRKGRGRKGRWRRCMHGMSCFHGLPGGRAAVTSTSMR